MGQSGTGGDMKTMIAVTTIGTVMGALLGSEIADNIIIDVNNNKYIPLVGSFANECILSIIPDLTINAPNRLIENTNIDNSTVQILRVDDFAET